MKRIKPHLPSVALFALAACGTPNPMNPPSGPTSFVSAPPAGGAGGAGALKDHGGQPPMANNSGNPQSPRTVQETDLYRLDGNRLYYLNSYRGLMVFDVSNVDQPKLLGRSPIFGSPVDMIVRSGIAVVVVGDWYGQMDDGTPFHGSIVRGIDASDPSHIRVLGEARLGGWVQDTRVVGDVLYAVSEDYGWVYGWRGLGGGGVVNPGSSQPQSTVIVSSVSFANNQIRAVGKKSYTGYSGIFNVTPNSILLAHPVEPANPPNSGPAKTQLLYLDISDPNGAIAERGTITVNGQTQGWGADNGRWNLDFADGKTAHVVGCAGHSGYCDGQSGYVLSTADFSKPDAPVLKSELTIPTPGWSVAARFDTGRLYLSPNGSYGNGASTPFQVYDLTDPVNPKLAGTLNIPGSVWNILPAPKQRLFALGNDWLNQHSGDVVSLKYIDASNPAAPQLLGTATFGQGWAWTPAAGTFKAFTMDAMKGLVVLPFSGWDYTAQTYNNGLQLIQFTDKSASTAGAAHTKGWVERGIFVHNRLVSLSDLALSVIDYTSVSFPKVITELTLARNVVAAQPGGSTIAQISTDWWDNDVSSSEVRVLPIANAEETSDAAGAPGTNVAGVGARVFTNGNLAYVVTNVQVSLPCKGPNPTPGPNGVCYGRAEQVQVVDLSNGGARLRGKVQLPIDDWGWYGWGWRGFWWYDWFEGAEVVQVGSDALAFRRWQPVYSPQGNYLDSNSLLYVVDLANADAPGIASATITTDPDGWWGNMRVVGQTLYTTHYEWFQKPGPSGQGTVKYYIDRIDLADRQHPVIGSKVNVPGLLVGGFDQDPSLLLFVDYHWDASSNTAKNDFNVGRLSNGVCELQSKTPLDGWVGETFVRGNIAYLSTQLYDYKGQMNEPQVQLHAIDLGDPKAPVDRVASGPSGWGWLLGVEGDRAIVSSGWGAEGVDVYRLASGQPPQFRQFVRTRGWWVNGLARQNNSLFLASGYWGVQQIDLQ